jgi:hypothetical protein
MMKMNKILGILLAVCFLMSVTVAAVSAAEPKGIVKKDEGPKFNDPRNHQEDGKKICHWVRAHWEQKVITIKKKVGFGRHKRTIEIKKKVWVRVPAKLVCTYKKNDERDDHNGPGPRR